MKKEPQGVPSPYQPRDSVPYVKEQLIAHLDTLRFPVPTGDEMADAECSRTCHINERNYVLDLIRAHILTDL